MGYLLKLKYALRIHYVSNLASTNVPFRPTTVKMPNLELIETKQITVYIFFYFATVIIFHVREFQTNPSGGSLSSILKL
jgi:hypothetical protein